MVIRNKILITGATGFVGNRLVQCLSEEKLWPIVALTRNFIPVPFASQTVTVPELSSSALNSTLDLGKVDVIVHLAARVHVMNDDAVDPLWEFRRTNVEGTCALAEQAARSGVKRFVFLSSIKVNGEFTKPGVPFTAKDALAPSDPYGQSKADAEEALFAIARKTRMEIVIIRPPLVYGPGVKGNFNNMAKLVKKGFPLPLGAIHNKRSLISLDNLVDLIITCIDHPAAANQVFLAADGEDLSTSDLLCRVAAAMGKPSRLIPFPAGLLQFGALLLGKRATAQRLLGSLQVDISKARNLLGWQPPLSVEEGLKRCFPE
ncbi:SDR family oxidoreductase [Marinobacter sp. ATCH36]|uniref:UDP-glucose 4-epimerase family protein n=1 Tax=Marinobacter sp. ATCH36 TaxID=2945106 RepID=UPI0020227095|nr:SDR family oxidoreductase [Marinobacter sp. ATCH36]MCL7945105.1 SDR family oxidoreductase [Marinobacter sp. ATCH36]